MQKEARDKDFIKKPFYEGGPQALKAFIAKHLRYPKEALENHIEGTVHVRFSITKSGKVRHPKVIAGLGYGCDEEAVRVIQLLEFVVPKNHVKGVKFHKTLQIHFRKQSATREISYQYQLTSSTEPTSGEEKKPRSYRYTITLNN